MKHWIGKIYVTENSLWPQCQPYKLRPKPEARKKKTTSHKPTKKKDPRQ